MRLVSWNVRHGLGLDRRVSLERVLEVLEPLDADVVALQELDVARVRSGGVDQPAWLAARLAMNVVFAETCDGYGHALLSRPPFRAHEEIALPGSALGEPRALIDAQLGDVRVIAAHFGLIPSDRAQQADAVMARLASDGSHVTFVLGDLNASPGRPGYVELVPALRDALDDVPLRARCTWPALWPFRALDHALVSPSVTVEGARVLGEGAARIASDHRPVAVDVRLAR